MKHVSFIVLIFILTSPIWVKSKTSDSIKEYNEFLVSGTQLKNLEHLLPAYLKTVKALTDTLSKPVARKLYQYPFPAGKCATSGALECNAIFFESDQCHLNTVDQIKDCKPRKDLQSNQMSTHAEGSYLLSHWEVFRRKLYQLCSKPSLTVKIKKTCDQLWELNGSLDTRTLKK